MGVDLDGVLVDRLGLDGVLDGVSLDRLVHNDRGVRVEDLLFQLRSATRDQLATSSTNQTRHYSLELLALKLMQYPGLDGRNTGVSSTGNHGMAPNAFGRLEIGVRNPVEVATKEPSLVRDSKANSFVLPDEERVQEQLLRARGPARTHG